MNRHALTMPAARHRTHGALSPVRTSLLQRKCERCSSASDHTNLEDDLRPIGVQRQLAVGSSNDVHEREADRVADEVLTRPGHPAVRQAPPGIQRRATPASTDASPAPASVARTLSGTGSPLEPALRQDMEGRFQHDFSRVRVHTGAQAEQSARDVQARAYTAGSHLVFGSRQFSPATQDGRRLLAHELTHVVQQGGAAATHIRRAPDSCKGKKRADSDKDVLDKTTAAEADHAQLTELYLALKRARACHTDFDEAAYLALVPASTILYTESERKSALKGYSRAQVKAIGSDDRKLAWAESLKPFAGYYLSGFDTANRFMTGRNRQKMGGTLAPGHESFRNFADKQGESTKHSKVQSAFSKANVLVFSGHQYAQYKLPGVWNTGNWDVTLDTRGLTGPLPSVKLLISTSCATLCTEAYQLWKTLFPNAVFLGAARSTPLKGSVLANAFVKNLPQDLLFDPGAPGLSGAIGAWKSAVEKTQGSAVRGGVLDIGAGTIEFWDGKAWKSMSATDADNKCKVKGDYSADVPDPRAP